MKTSWEARKAFFKAVDLNDNLAVEQASQDFAQAKRRYWINGLTDSELEMYMFQLVALEYAELKSALATEKISILNDGEVREVDDGIIDKLILRDYASGYIEKVLPGINTLVAKAPSSKSLQADQNLFALRNKIVLAHQQLISGVLKQYLVETRLTEEGYEIICALTGEKYLLSSDNLLSLVLDRSKDMFNFTDRMPGGKHPEPIFNYDGGYWRRYSIAICQNYINNDKEFREKLGTETDSEYAKYDSITGIASFKKSLAEYQDYAEGYKFSQDLVVYQNNKKKPGVY